MVSLPHLTLVLSSASMVIRVFPLGLPFLTHCFYFSYIFLCFWLLGVATTLPHFSCDLYFLVSLTYFWSSLDINKFFLFY
jgi:hypothetical protein